MNGRSREFRVQFFKKADPETKQKEEYLGSIVVNDVGTSPHLTLVAKAFRHADPGLLRADKTRVSPFYGIK